MKMLTTFAAFFLIAVGVFLSCKKTPPGPPTPAPANQPPIARAGADVSGTLSSCSDRVNVDLDGSSSTDPDGKIVSYSWREISGPGAGLLNPTSAKAKVQNIGAGDYAFELSVTDNRNAVSKDTMLISVKPATSKEYDLDIAFLTSYKFDDNFEYCYYGPPCLPNDIKYYSDITTIQGKGTFLPFGEFDVYVSEYADTAALKYASASDISLYGGTMNSASLYGAARINLKKLIQQGGGPFNSTFTVTGGSASGCDPKVFTNLPPLNVTGSLDTATHKVSLRIYGKTFF